MTYLLSKSTQPGIFLAAFVVIISFSKSFSQEENVEKPVETISDLKEALENVLSETSNPAVGIALVNKEGPIWVAGLGKSNVEDDVDANENTMFRIGSTSKMFASLSILKLQEEGRVNLDDKVRDLVPEIEFENQWEETDPVRVAHLLEHTTGWDDIHLTEYAHSDPDPISLKDGLDFHPHSRISRWVPGSRMSYCNSGPPVAGYIVEKITGKAYEDYVQETFFKPMGVENMTYFYTDEYEKLGATLYIEGEPQPYWHILVRASGSINASPKDMAKMMMFFLNRGVADSVQIVSEASLNRMETPSTTSGAKAGLEAGYGLSNYSSTHEEFVYREHNGGVNGGITEFSYLPEYGLGHVIMINSGDGSTFRKISNLVRNFETKDLKRKVPVLPTELSEAHKALAGYYVTINPRQQGGYFMERIMNIQHLKAEDGFLTVKELLGGEPEKYIPSTDKLFRAEKTGVITMAVVEDPLEGKSVQIDNQVMKPVSAIMAFGQLAIVGLWVLFLVSSILYGFIWVARYFLKKIEPGPSVTIRLWPLVTSLLLVLTVIFIIIGINDPFVLLGSPGFVSVTIMILSILFALAAVWSILNVIRVRKSDINKLIYWYAAILSCLHFIASFYLLWHGIVGVRTWS